MRILAIAAVLLAVLPATVHAGEPEKKPKESRICRQTPAINSRLPGRMLCKTAKEWAVEDYHLQRGTAIIQGTSLLGPGDNSRPSIGR